MAFDRNRLKAQLMRDESVQLRLYVDTEGKITIGVGRNLTDRGISESEAMMMLDNDIADAVLECIANVPNFRKLNAPRQEVMVNMMFNLGWPKLRTFTLLMAALTVLDYDAAAREMLDSKWARQVKGRADRLAKIMKEGKYD